MSVLLLLVMLVSCKSPKVNDDPLSSQTFRITNAAQPIPIKLRSSFVFELESNPTTGYRWAMEIEPEGSITKKLREYTAGSGDQVGIGGTTSWTLTASKVGTTTVTFRYERPWEKGVKPAREVAFTINVR